MNEAIIFAIIIFLVYLLIKGLINYSVNTELEKQKNNKFSFPEIENANTDQKNQNQNIQETKGTEFEEYVENMFSKEKFEIIWKTPHRNENGNLPKDVKYPDYKFREISTGKEFWIECKFRSYPINGSIQWTNTEQLSRYRLTEIETKTPVLIMIGLYKTPKNPSNIYCMDLKTAKYPNLYMSVCNNHILNTRNIECIEDLNLNEVTT